jgi:hypothetical protein
MPNRDSPNNHTHKKQENKSTYLHVLITDTSTCSNNDQLDITEAS